MMQEYYIANDIKILTRNNVFKYGNQISYK